MKSQSVNYPLLFVVGIVICLFTVVGLQRLDIDTDIVKSLPNHEQVIVDALEIFDNHPIHDQVAVDGKFVRAKKLVYIALNKPPGCVC